MSDAESAGSRRSVSYRASKYRSTRRLRPVAACATTISSSSPAAGSKEEGVGRVLRLIPVWVAQAVEEGLEHLLVGRRHLNTDQNTAVIVALVTVVEETDIPFRAHGAQKRHQCTGALWEFKAEQHFVFGERRLAAHHVAQMGLGHFIARQIERVEALLAETGGELLDLGFGTDLQAHEHVRLVGIRNAIVEFGDVALAHRFAQAQKAAALFGDREREHRLAGLA